MAESKLHFFSFTNFVGVDQLRIELRLLDCNSNVLAIITIDPKNK